MKPIRFAAASAVAGILLATSASVAQAQTAAGGSVTVVHGIPDLPVDVYVNGELTLDDFAPATVTDPISLPAGDYDLAIRAADAEPTDDALLSAQASVTDGLNASIVAHLDAGGSPTVSVFVNDIAPIAAGNARLTVRHTAAAPAVDVRANGTAAFTNLENPNEAKADLPAGTISADVVLAGTADVAIGPADLNLVEGTNTIVYAIGSAADANLGLAVQSISGLHSGPGSVDTGSGGFAADRSSPVPLWAAAAAIGGVLLAGTGSVTLIRSRRRP